MKINRITLQEWHSYASAEADLSRVTVASVIGRNALAPERSNGCGKSFLLESVLYALYGYDRDPTSIQRLKAKSDTFVEVEFEHRGQHARVKRGFKIRGDGQPGPGFLEFEIDGKSQGDKFKELEPQIEEFVGCNLELYMSTCFFTQEEADQFVRATPTRRRDILYDLLGLGVYESARKIAATEETMLRAEVGSLVNQRGIENLGAEAAQRIIDEHASKDFPALVAAKERLIEELIALQGDFEVSRAGIQAFGAAIQPLRRRVEEVFGQCDVARRGVESANKAVTTATTNRDNRRTSLVAEYRKRQEEIKGLPKAEAEVAAASAALEAARADCAKYGPQDDIEKGWKDFETRAVSDKSAADTRMSQASADLTRVRTLGPVCPKCGQNVAPEHRAAHEAQFSKQHDDAKTASGEAAGRVAQAREALESIRKIKEFRQNAAVVLAGAEPKVEATKKALALIQKVVADEATVVAAAQTELAGLDAQITEAKGAAERAVTELSRLQGVLEEARAALAAAESGLDPDASPALMRLHAAVVQRTKDERLALEGVQVQIRAVAEARARLEQHRARMIELDGQIAAKTFDADVRTFIVKACSKAGIPLLVMENVVSEIERGTVEILATMESPSRVHFRTETSTGRETILIEVETPDGTRGLKSFSGGQVTEINLAIRLALSEVLSRRADVGFDSVFLDEVMAPLDGPARQCFLRVVHLMRRSFRQVFVISHHDEIKNMLESCITVTWSPEGSTVEVAA